MAGSHTGPQRNYGNLERNPIHADFLPLIVSLFGSGPPFTLFAARCALPGNHATRKLRFFSADPTWERGACPNVIISNKNEFFHQVFQTLGVEAARIIISEEITYIMKAYGISIDRRHLLLLADVMTFKVRVVVSAHLGVKTKCAVGYHQQPSWPSRSGHVFQ